MKKIVITGETGYIATKLRDSFGTCEQVQMLSLRGNEWRAVDFFGQDIVIHTAGIVHQRENRENIDIYYRVNRDITVELAKKAKRQGVRQFVFFSTASVYGMDEGIITRETIPTPNSHYGKSKLQAEKALRALHDETFTVAILRPPMVYGPGCKGNYRRLVKLAQILPVFADYPNERSMISIERLCEFVREIVDIGMGGIFFPQDAQYGCTCRMIRDLARAGGRYVHLTKALNPAVSLLRSTTRSGKKAFGTLIYQDRDPCIVSF